MAPPRQLQLLLADLPGRPREVLARLLALACERLDVDLGLVGARDPDGRLVQLVVRRDGTPTDRLGRRREPLVAELCARVLDTGGLLLADLADDPALSDLAERAASVGVVSCAGVPVQTGDRVLGALVVVGDRPHDSLNARDLALLHELAEVAAPLLPALAQRPTATLADLDRVAEAVAGARDLDELTRPLLDVLHDLTGLGSTYLTTIDVDAGVQLVRAARNAGEGFEIPEGLSVPWADTLCKRSLEEGRQVTEDVQAVWGDSAAARELGIAVYMSVPVELSDGQVWGTLCAADATSPGEVERHLPTMRLFARLIASEVERETVLMRERERAARAEAAVLQDPLTGCATRRAVGPWLDTEAGACGPDETLLAAYVDVDEFKTVNDAHGHAAGDAVLAAVGRHLLERSRPGDLVARLGGDEFLVAARVPRRRADAVAERLRRSTHLETEHDGRRLPVRLSVGVVLSDDDAAATILERADRAMYRTKRRRRRTDVDQV